MDTNSNTDSKFRWPDWVMQAEDGLEQASAWIARKTRNWWTRTAPKREERRARFAAWREAKPKLWWGNVCLIIAIGLWWFGHPILAAISFIGFVSFFLSHYNKWGRVRSEAGEIGRDYLWPAIKEPLKLLLGGFARKNGEMVQCLLIMATLLTFTWLLRYSALGFWFAMVSAAFLFYGGQRAWKHWTKTPAEKAAEKKATLEAKVSAGEEKLAKQKERLAELELRRRGVEIEGQIKLSQLQQEELDRAEQRFLAGRIDQAEFRAVHNRIYKPPKAEGSRRRNNQN